MNRSATAGALKNLHVNDQRPGGHSARPSHPCDHQRGRRVSPAAHPRPWSFCGNTKVGALGASFQDLYLGSRPELLEMYVNCILYTLYTCTYAETRIGFCLKGFVTLRCVADLHLPQPFTWSFVRCFSHVFATVMIN